MAEESMKRFRCSVDSIYVRKFFRFTIWVNWSAIKARLLMGCPNGPCFTIQTAEMDSARTYFGELLFQFVAQNKQFFVKWKSLFLTLENPPSPRVFR